MLEKMWTCKTCAFFDPLNNYCSALKAVIKNPKGVCERYEP